MTDFVLDPFIRYHRDSFMDEAEDWQRDHAGNYWSAEVRSGQYQKRRTLAEAVWAAAVASIQHVWMPQEIERLRVSQRLRDAALAGVRRMPERYEQAKAYDALLAVEAVVRRDFIGYENTDFGKALDTLHALLWLPPDNEGSTE